MVMRGRAEAREAELEASPEAEQQLLEDPRGGSHKPEAVPQWDVSHAPAKTGTLNRLTMIAPAITHFVANIGIAAPAVAGGYAIAKAGNKLGVNKRTMDSKALRASAAALLWSNGIVPTVEYEPVERGIKSQTDIAVTPLLVSNHTSYIDGLILACVFKFPRVVAMSDSRKVPVIGKFMEEMDVLFVDRTSSNSRQQTLEAISEHCQRWKTGEPPLLIFPEGKTSNGEGLLDFKKGAFLAGLPVRPVIMVYTSNWDPACCTYRDTGCGDLEEVSAAEWGKQFVGHFVHSVHIRVLPPYVPNDLEKADPQVYAQNCQRHMADAHKRIRAELQNRSWTRAALQSMSHTPLASCLCRST